MKPRLFLVLLCGCLAAPAFLRAAPPGGNDKPATARVRPSKTSLTSPKARTLRSTSAGASGSAARAIAATGPDGPGGTADPCRARP